MGSSLVSVIIPVYNAEKYIGKCIESILIQTHKNIEIIVVNDGSKDRSHEKINEYTTIHKNLKYILQHNSGVAEARKTGVMNASGEYVTFVDADDWLPNDAIENLYNKCVEHNLDYAAGIPLVYFSKSHISPSPRKFPGIFIGEDFLNILLQPGGNLPNWGALSKRILWTEDMFPTHKVPAEDQITNVKLSRNIKRAGIFNDLQVYYYCLNPESLTSTGTLFKQELWELYSNELRSNLAERNLLEKYEENIRLLEIDKIAFNTSQINKTTEWIQNIYSYSSKNFPLKYKILHFLIKHPFFCKKTIDTFHSIKGLITKSERQSYLKS